VSRASRIGSLRYANRSPVARLEHGLTPSLDLIPGRAGASEEPASSRLWRRPVFSVRAKVSPPPILPIAFPLRRRPRPWYR